MQNIQPTRFYATFGMKNGRLSHPRKIRKKERLNTNMYGLFVHRRRDASAPNVYYMYFVCILYSVLYKCIYSLRRQERKITSSILTSANLLSHSWDLSHAHSHIQKDPYAFEMLFKMWEAHEALHPEIALFNYVKYCTLEWSHVCSA